MYIGVCDTLDSVTRQRLYIIGEPGQVQRAWMYLENIFSAEDIQKQLPAEATKFKQVDKFWKETFRKARHKRVEAQGTLEEETCVSVTGHLDPWSGKDTQYFYSSHVTTWYSRPSARCARTSAVPWTLCACPTS